MLALTCSVLSHQLTSGSRTWSQSRELPRGRLPPRSIRGEQRWWRPGGGSGRSSTRGPRSACERPRGEERRGRGRRRLRRERQKERLACDPATAARGRVAPSKSAIGKYYRGKKVSYSLLSGLRSFAYLVHRFDVPACRSTGQLYTTSKTTQRSTHRFHHQCRAKRDAWRGLACVAR